MKKYQLKSFVVFGAVLISLSAQSSRAEGIEKVAVGQVQQRVQGGNEMEEVVTDLITDQRSLYYYDDASLRDAAKKTKNGAPVVFFSTGFSGSGLGKMNKSKNQIKEKRGFSIAYLLALRMHHLGIPGKVFYFTFQETGEGQRRYLYDLVRSEARKNVVVPRGRVGKQDAEDETKAFRDFEASYFEQVVFSARKLIPNLGAKDKRRYTYLLDGPNFDTKERLFEKVRVLKERGAFFAGMEYHFGGPFFQFIADDLELQDMQLLGSEIFDQLGDEDVRLHPNERELPHQSKFEEIVSTQSFGKRTQRDSKIPADLGTKSQCRRLYRDIGVPHARGSYWPVKAVDPLIAELYEFFKLNRDVFNVVVKLERSSAGDGNITYKFREVFESHPEFWTNTEIAHALIKAHLEKAERFSINYQRRIRDHGAVFEAFIEGANFKSPAVLGMIMPDEKDADGQVIKEGNVEVYFSYNQLLDGQSYIGSLGPANNENMKDFNQADVPEADLITHSKRILKGLKDIGANGAVGIDFVTWEVIEEGKRVRKAAAIENNVRHTGTMYPYRSFFFIAGREIMERNYFKSTNNIKVAPMPSGKEIDVRKWFYLDFIKNNKNSYNPKTESGCIIYLDSWAGKEVGIACIADREEHLNRIFKDFGDSITKETNRYIAKKYPKKK